jgi:hypothetical protein
MRQCGRKASCLIRVSKKVGWIWFLCRHNSYSSAFQMVIIRLKEKYSKHHRYEFIFKSTLIKHITTIKLITVLWNGWKLLKRCIWSIVFEFLWWLCNNLGDYSCGENADIWGCIQKLPDWVDNEINNNNKHSLRSNTKGYGHKIHWTDSQNNDTTASSGWELYNLLFSLQAVSLDIFGHTLICNIPTF